MKLIQCVPNFSEGRRVEVVAAIVAAIGAASDARVIDYSLDADHNRSVVTILGAPEDVRKAAVAGAKAAVEMIDMSGHAGEHPRIGAVDVIPVVPLLDVTMHEAVLLSREIGQDIADGLSLPVYLYERSATAGHRENLANVRKGGFEALKAASLTGHREPDFGPSEAHPTAGAVAVGARGPLIAFNVNLATDDLSVAVNIAATIRRLRASHTALVGVKAIAVCLGSRGIAQVSTNVTRPDKTSIYDVFRFVEGEARAQRVEVLESEIIGALWAKDLPADPKKAIKLRGFREEQVLDRWM